MTLGAAILRNSSTAFSTHFYFTKHVTGFNITVIKMMMVSDISPVINAITPTAINIMIENSLTVLKILTKAAFSFHEPIH